MTGNDVDVIGVFQEELAKYRAYAEYLGQDCGVVSMSAQCLADRETQSGAPLIPFVALKRAS